LATERVSIVGYSVPLTDLTTANMLEHSIGRLNRGNAVQQIDVVDPYPKAALESLRAWSKITAASSVRFAFAAVVLVKDCSYNEFSWRRVSHQQSRVSHLANLSKP
jgi:hypothetical protein